MKLKILTIIIQSPEDFFNSIPKSPKLRSSSTSHSIKFDSEKTFNSIFTLNKLQILRAVSQFKPESIYKLAGLLGREPQHVLKDCRLLESFKFLKLEENTLNGRATLVPSLFFDYDVINVYSKLFPQSFHVSKKAENLLLNI